MLTEDKEKELQLLANDIRISLIEMLTEANSGHTAGPLGMADIFTAMYFHVLNHNPQKPFWPERDRMILSNGHIVPIRYVTMAYAGYFPKEELKTLRKFGSRLQGHPEMHLLPGLETTSGPLGSGLSQAAGIAYAARMDNAKFRTYVMMSDGELNAGNTWEGVMFAGANKLSNLTAVIDRNYIQINGSTEDVMPLEPLADKWQSFGWHVIDVDGHNMEEFVEAVEKAKAMVDKPTVIIARTIPGKGIKEIEYDYRWHGDPPGKGPGGVIPKDKQKEVFLEELRTLKGKIQASHND